MNTIIENNSEINDDNFEDLGFEPGIVDREIEERFKCDKCNEYADHGIICKGCSKPFCYDCIVWCRNTNEYNHCEAEYCYDCSPECDCGNWVCDGCQENVKCECCGTQICMGCGLYCDNCQSWFCIGCMGPASIAAIEAEPEYYCDPDDYYGQIKCLKCESPITISELKSKINIIKDYLGKLQLTEENEAKIMHVKNMMKTYRLKRKNLTHRLIKIHDDD